MPLLALRVAIGELCTSAVVLVCSLLACCATATCIPCWLVCCAAATRACLPAALHFACLQ
jgi:hypothetical protein